MSATAILAQIRRLPLGEQNTIVEKFWEEFGEGEDELTPKQAAELERRAEDALKNPGRGTPIEEVSAEIRRCLLAGK